MPGDFNLPSPRFTQVPARLSPHPLNALTYQRTGRHEPTYEMAMRSQGTSQKRVGWACSGLVAFIQEKRTWPATLHLRWGCTVCEQAVGSTVGGGGQPSAPGELRLELWFRGASRWPCRCANIAPEGSDLTRISSFSNHFTSPHDSARANCPPGDFRTWDLTARARVRERSAEQNP